MTKLSPCCTRNKDPKAKKRKLRQQLIKKHLKTAKIEDMTRTPLEEKDLIEVPVYISMKKKVPVEWTFKSSEIKTPALRLIYEGKSEEAVQAFSNLCHENNWERDF